MHRRELSQALFSVFTILALNLGMVTSIYGQAGEGQIPELLIFSGSDWCIPCIKFDREVRQDPEFIAFTKSRVKVKVADFPQRVKLDKALEEQNEALAEKYNPEGIFPYVVLLSPNGKVLVQIKTNKVTSQNVIDQISEYLPKHSIVERSREKIIMGSGFQITLVAYDDQIEELLDECITEIETIESWLSSWNEGSITSALNSAAASSPVKVSHEYYELVGRCLRLSDLTQGAFDISFRGLNGLYQFDKQEHQLPAKSHISDQLQNTGYEKIKLLDGDRIGFSQPGMTIGFGAIGKGFAADQIREIMERKGVLGGVINASGDLTTWGRSADGSEWSAGIPDPDNRANIVLGLPLTNKSIATSGDYEKYFTNNGLRYSHIINPKTGYPVIGSSSVSVISSSAELSDALATAVSVLGVEVGLDLINQLADVECIFIDNNRKLHFSDGLRAYEN